MRSRSLSILVLATVAFSTGARATVPDEANPYAGIAVRNVFGLKPPPPPAAPPPVIPVVPKITLTGIYNFGRTKALMMVAVPPKPPAPAKEESYILGEGERDGDIEVLAIDDKAGTVKVNNHGTEQTLDFVNNGAKLPAMAAMPTPGQIPAPTVASFQPQPGPGSSGMGGAQTLVSPSGDSQPRMGAGGMTTAASANSQNTLTPEEQTVLIEAQRAKLMDAGDENYKILPITDMTSQLLGNDSENGSASKGGSNSPRPF